MSQDIITITRTDDLARFCETAKSAPYVTVDTEFLRERDRHFNTAWRGPEFIAQVQAQWDAEEAAGGEEEDSIERWAEYRPQNYGFNDVRVLEGNIGYMAVTTFNPLIASQSKADAALSFLADTDAVIIDLRGNRGDAFRKPVAGFGVEGVAGGAGRTPR